MKKNFKVGENVIWKCMDEDFDIIIDVKCKIIEVNSEYCVARSCGNHNSYDDMNLLIDEDSENDFIKIK